MKGIADYADGAESTTEIWSPFASVMAASLVAHILMDPMVFRSWPHCHTEGDYSKINKLFSLNSSAHTIEEIIMPITYQSTVEQMHLTIFQNLQQKTCVCFACALVAYL